MPDGSAHRIEVPDGLTYCSDEQVGLRRVKAGQGFRYLDRHEKPVTDERTLARIQALAIPPAWTDVWICPRATGHIQATGRDARGRKQYRYHPDWSTARAETKFGRVAAFGRKLPRLRKRVEEDLGKRGLTREKVLATTVRLLELTLIRVGNVEYARQNRSFGLTTLNKRHLDVDGSALRFHFRGKSGKDHEVSVRDQRLARVIRSLQDLPGQQVFKYREPDGDLCPVTSEDVNAYIRDAMGEDFSAKDFRTWAGTVSAARALRGMEPSDTKTQSRGRITKCVKAVSGLLGNTPAVCRSAYIHPRVFDLYESGELFQVLPGPDAKAFEPALIKALG
jgi:DNA topoisomerase-1